MNKHSVKGIKIGLVVKKDLRAEEKADELEKWLIAKKVKVVRKEYLPPSPIFSDKIKKKAPAGLCCVLVLGGDGTFLTAVRWIGDQDIPVLGVKFGDVGFLAETSEDQLYDAVEAVLANRFSTSSRMRLLVKVFRNNKEIVCESVLNDIVINKGALARLAHIQTYINDHYLTTYRADGLIVATTTGSTAYSLAAGGPVVHPSVPAIIMTPICPFTLTNRPLIIPDTSIIKIKLEKPLSNIMLTFDGQQGMKINKKDVLVIQKGVKPIKMITVPGQDYFDVLKTKLRWSGGRV
ncbi:MAG: NAD(+)/NADH kinase [Pseudomonadota bacterium]